MRRLLLALTHKPAGEPRPHRRARDCGGRHSSQEQNQTGRLRPARAGGRAAGSGRTPPGCLQALFQRLTHPLGGGGPAQSVQEDRDLFISLTHLLEPAARPFIFFHPLLYLGALRRGELPVQKRPQASIFEMRHQFRTSPSGSSRAYASVKRRCARESKVPIEASFTPTAWEISR